MDLWPLFITLFVIGAAELGDKTQLLVLGFAARYPFWKIMSAVLSATAILMAVAVIFGGAINRYIPPFYVQLAAGSIFIAFGLWTLLGKEEGEGEKAKGDKNPFLIVFSSFFLAELGDKTQLAALALSAKYGAPFQVWIGATLGMAGINVLAALAGSWLGKFIPEKAIKSFSAAIFIIFGLFTLGSLIMQG